MYYVYNIQSKHPDDGEVKTYIGITGSVVERAKSHRSSFRYKEAEWINCEVVFETPSISEALKKEYELIDEALGGVLKDGNRENFEGSCLNRSTVASFPLGDGMHLCYSAKRQFYVK
jgi:predicted GIY-YIG superfamily endonuclease